MRVLAISGASTKIGFMAGACEAVLNKGYKPNAIVGISAGAILAVPMAMNMTSKIKEILFKLSADDIFSVKPVNAAGHLTIQAMWRAITRKASFGVQGKIEKLLRSIVTFQLFRAYTDSVSTPDIYVGAVDMNRGTIEYFNLKTCEYELAIAIIMASSSIPVYTEPVNIGGRYFCDGGLVDHIGTGFAMQNIRGVTRIVSIFSRPKENDLNNVEWKPNGIKAVLARTIEIMSSNISRDDEAVSDAMAKAQGIHQDKIFAPYRLTDTAYEMSPTLTRAWYSMGYDAGKAQFTP